jgi:hypothetical protein
MCRLQLCSRVLRSNPVKLSAGDFEAQIKPPKLAGEAYPLRLLDDLDTCHRPFYTAWSAGPLAPPLDLVNTVYSSICTLACRCPPSVSHPRSFFRPSRSLDPSLTSTVHRSQSIGMTHSTWPSAYASTASMFHTCTPQVKRHVIYQTHVKVSFKLNRSLIISWQSLIIKSTHMDKYQNHVLWDKNTVRSLTGTSSFAGCMPRAWFFCLSLTMLFNDFASSNRHSSSTRHTWAYYCFSPNIFFVNVFLSKIL